MRPFNDKKLDITPEDLFRHPDLPLSGEMSDDTPATRDQQPRLSARQADCLRPLFYPDDIPDRDSTGPAFGLELSAAALRLTPSHLSQGFQSRDAWGIHEVACAKTVPSMRERHMAD